MMSTTPIIGLLVATLVVVAGPLRAEEGPVQIEFSTTSVDGHALDLERWRGQWVVVNFWATWCKPCLKEMPEFSDLHTQRDDINVIGLAYEEVEPEVVREFLGDNPVSYPVALIDVYQPPEVFGTPRVLPTTLILSPEGHQVKTFLGPVTREMLENFVDSVP